MQALRLEVQRAVLRDALGVDDGGGADDAFQHHGRVKDFVDSKHMDFPILKNSRRMCTNKNHAPDQTFLKGCNFLSGKIQILYGFTKLQ